MRVPVCVAASHCLLMTWNAMQALQRAQEESAQLKAAQAEQASK